MVLQRCRAYGVGKCGRSRWIFVGRREIGIGINGFSPFRQAKSRGVEGQKPRILRFLPLRMEHPAFEMEHPAFEMEHPAFEMEHPAFEMEHPAFEMEHPAFEMEHCKCTKPLRTRQKSPPEGEKQQIRAVSGQFNRTR
jgi:hypothetical protein